MAKNQAAKGTWRAKLEREHEAKIVDIPPRMQRQWGTGTMVIGRALDVDAILRSVRKGRLTTVKQVMDRLARMHGADTACPMTTGIFVRIVAETAEEDRAAGRKRITPYWRTLKTGGLLNAKYPGGTSAQASKLRAEGHVIQAGKGKQPPRVKDHESALAPLDR